MGILRYPISRKIEKMAEIRGMLLVLNKIWWKIPKEWAEYAVAEASDLSSVTGGHFKFDKKKERVVFKFQEDYEKTHAPKKVKGKPR